MAELFGSFDAENPHNNSFIRRYLSHIILIVFVLVISAACMAGYLLRNNTRSKAAEPDVAQAVTFVVCPGQGGSPIQQGEQNQQFIEAPSSTPSTTLRTEPSPSQTVGSTPAIEPSAGEKKVQGTEAVQGASNEQCDYHGGEGIKQAVDAAHNRDTVLIKAGTYLVTTGTSISNKNLTITGEGSASTVIDVQVEGNHPLFTIEGTSVATITKMRIRATDAFTGFGLLIQGSPTVTILSNVLTDFNNNEVSPAIMVSEHSHANIRSNIFYENYWALYVGDASFGVTNNVFYHNQRAFGVGGAYGNSNRVALNNIFARNEVYALYAGGGAHFSRIGYNMFWLNGYCTTPADLCTAHYSISLPNPPPAPIFVNPAPNRDFHLTENSPARNRGHIDILDPDGTRSDMGAYGGPDACGLDPSLPGCGNPTPTLPAP